jgi:hypothetical protein
VSEAVDLLRTLLELDALDDAWLVVLLGRRFIGTTEVVEPLVEVCDEDELYVETPDIRVLAPVPFTEESDEATEREYSPDHGRKREATHCSQASTPRRSTA